MRQVFVASAVFVLLFLSPTRGVAQSSQDASLSVPRLITITGVYRPADGKPPAAIETVTLSVYADAEGGAPLFQETQQVTLDDRGRYSIVLGAAHADGIPSSIFAAGGQWLGTVFERTGEIEGPRVRLTSVPYALRAADADTLGGRPASDYVLGTGSTTSGRMRSTSSDAAPADEQPGTVNFLAKYVGPTTVANSALYETGGAVGLGTTVPLDLFHVRFTNTGGNATGLAVQNLGNTATSYSGMLFYDQNGALGQFQGFNNVTHEYRINNVARNGATTLDGSINFMIGGTSRFFVNSTTNVGIGTSSPVANLEVSNATTGTPGAVVLSTTFASSGTGGLFWGRHARGTPGTPTAILNGDSLASFQGAGFGATAFSPARGGMVVRAAENWTDAAQGTFLSFNVTPTGTTSPSAVMTITPSGQVGIGTTAPADSFEVSRTFGYKTYFTNYEGVTKVIIRKARGANPPSPLNVLDGNNLGGYFMSGYGATGFGNEVAGMMATATEDWSDTAQGTKLTLGATPNGTTLPWPYVVIQPDGKVAIHPPVDINFHPSPALDDLEVFGDIRVGTTGTNGCLKDFSGAGIAGTCSSDLRLKKDITPFGSVLNQLTALQPVHYFWRASEFPDRHFGTSRADGLIAQDVEQILPDLVVTDSDGYKAVNYSKLPLLTVEAVKELKTENDALKERVATLERLVSDLIAAAHR